MECFMIDNIIVERNKNRIRLIPVRLAHKLHPNMDISSIRVITTGNRISDHKYIIHGLLDRYITFDQIKTMWKIE